MYKTFILNTVISAVAYFIISIIGIAVVGLLAGHYGIAAYGIITLARLFLPTGLIGLLDLGAPENASHEIATARSNGDWKIAGAMLAALSFIVLVASSLAGIILFLMSPLITKWFAVSSTDAYSFQICLDYIALILPVSILGLVAEGAIRGFERYGLARGIEVWTSLAYGIACFLAIHYNLSHIEIIYISIAMSLLRALIAIALCAKCFNGLEISFLEWRTIGLTRAWKRTCVTAPNKILGTIQTQSQPLFIGIFLGSASAGIYDVIMRLPRFAKSVLGLINSAVIPFISKLEATDQKDSVTRAVENGMLWVAFMSSAPLFAAATFSKPILHLWIGKDLTEYWLWQSLSFSTPLITVLLGFGFNSLFGRTHVYRILNRFSIIRILLQYIIAFALITKLEERAFILGAAIVWMITSIWEFRLIFREHSVSKNSIIQIFSILLLGGVLMILALPFTDIISSITILLTAMTVYSILFWAVAWLTIIPIHKRQALLKAVSPRKFIVNAK